ncbi:MAG TPA: hypothetical protein VK507_02855, partial [Iamia sp.]|nr:hypothetical protein [Iamia sp.]
MLVPRRRGAPYTQRRIVAALGLALVLVGSGVGVSRLVAVVGGGDDMALAETTDAGASLSSTPESTVTPSTETAVPSPADEWAAALPSALTTMDLRERIGGDISPKSVVASGHGLVSAQNMMYTHTVTFYEGDGTLAATMADSVELADFGIDGHPGTSQGAPVEAAFTADGRHAYISNYSMYGTGF